MPRNIKYTVKTLRAEAKAAYARGKGNRALKGYNKMSKHTLLQALGRSEEAKVELKRSRSVTSTKTAGAVAATLGGDNTTRKALIKGRLLRAVKREITKARKANPNIAQEKLRKIAGLAFASEVKAIRLGLAEVKPKRGGFKPKSQETGTSASPRRTTEFAKKWSGAFANIPEDLKNAIQRFGEPKELSDGEATTAFFLSGTEGIHMDGHVNPKDSFNQAVYRHEYGHYLDYELGSSIINRALKKLGLSSIPDFNDESADSYKKLRAIQDKLGIGNSALKHKFISSFPAGKEAVFNDEIKLTQQAKRAESIYIKTFDRLNKSIRYGLMVKSELQGVEPTQKQKVAIGRKLAIEEINEKFNENSRIAALNEPLHMQFQKRKEHYYLEIDRALLNRKDIYGQIYRRLKNSPEHKAMLLVLVPKLIVASKTKDPELLASIADKIFDTGSTQDLIGSITANRVGKGHSDEYYQGPKGVINRHTEAFANLTDLHGRGDVLASRVANTLVPHTYNFFKEAINAK